MTGRDEEKHLIGAFLLAAALLVLLDLHVILAGTGEGNLAVSSHSPHRGNLPRGLNIIIIIIIIIISQDSRQE